MDAVISDAASPAVAAEAQRQFRPAVYWYVTFRCNLACKHCWVNSSPSVDTSEDLTTDEMLDVVAQMRELGAGRVLLSGGEALYRPDMLTVIRELLGSRINVSLETNGLLVTRKLTDLIKWGRDVHGAELTPAVSMDGGTSETHDFLRGRGTFERVLQGMRTLRDEGITFDAQCVINKTNIETIPALLERMSEMTPMLRRMQLAFLHAVGRGDKLVDKYGLEITDYNRAFDLVLEHGRKFPGQLTVKTPPALIPPDKMVQMFAFTKKMGCSTSCAFPTLGVLNDGRITVCALTRDDPGLCFGNVRTHRLLDIWKQKRMMAMREHYLAAQELQGICGDCIFQKECRGGCRALAYDELGDWDAAHPLCANLAEVGQFPSAYRKSLRRDARQPEAVN